MSVEPPPAAALPPPPPPGAWAQPVVPGAAAADEPRLRISRLWWFTGPVLAALVVTLTILAAMPVPYLALGPGSARVVEPLVTVSGLDGGPGPVQEAADTDLLFVTVSVRRPSGIEALWRLTDETYQVSPEREITGTQTRQENRAFNVARMTDSQQRAAKVALEAVGYEVPVTTSGAVVTDLAPDYPVADVLTPGDTIVAADGRPVTSSRDLVAVIGSHRPGDVVELTIDPLQGQEERTVRAELAANPEDPQRPQLGVSLQDRPEYEFPLRVEIDSGEVSGPSAGLAFTLAIIDRLTDGDLTGDRKVAVTGTIDLDGSVGPVGGVAQKTEAAVAAGADLFLVPPSEREGAERAARGRLEVHEVATLADALAALEAEGGDPVPRDAGDQEGPRAGD